MGQGQKCAKLRRSLNARQGQDEDSSGSLKKSSYTVTNEHSGTLEWTVFGTGTIYGHLLNKIIIIIIIDGVCVPLLHLQAFHSPLPETTSAVSKLSEYPEV